MILVARVPDGYALRRADAPPDTALVVDVDELADAIAALLDDTIDTYIDHWEVLTTLPATVEWA